MKHLKRFNEGLSMGEIDDFKKEIMELFQDVIDEFDIEELPYYLDDMDEMLGIFYNINDFPLTRLKNKPYIEIEIYVGDKFIDKFKSMKSSIIEFCDHLKSIGYKVDTNGDIKDYISSLYANNGGESYCSTIAFEIHIYYK